MAVRTRPGRLPEVIADRIQEEILAGGLGPGDQLPTEVQLIEQHDVSRTVIREAARILEHRGLVDVRPGRGMIVTSIDTSRIAQQYRLLLTMSPAAFDQLMDVRALVEVHIAGLAAENHTATQLAALEANVAQMHGSTRDYEERLATDLRFHALIGEASGNPLMSLFVDPINECLRHSYRGIETYLDEVDLSVLEHQQIVDAIAARDVEGARQAAARHLERVRHAPQAILGSP